MKNINAYIPKCIIMSMLVSVWFGIVSRNETETTDILIK